MSSTEVVKVTSAKQLDPATGRQVTRWTDLAANDQLLYFTSPSHTVDGRWLVLLSDRGGHYNIWALERQSGIMHRVSDNSDGYVRSYVYFDGHRDGRGLGRASVALDAARNRVYYIQGTRIMRADLDDGECRQLAILPDDEVSAFTHVSACGRYLCVPTIHRMAFDVANNGRGGVAWADNQVGRTADRLGIESTVRVFDTESGKETLQFSEPGWVTHVQFRPTNPRHILFNHEWTECSATRRMWLWNGRVSTRLRPASELVDPRGSAVHEVWYADGKCLFYHGSYFVPTPPTTAQERHGLTHGQPYVARCFPDADFRQEIPLRTGCRYYGHFMPDATGQAVVSDGYYEEAAVMQAAPPDGNRRRARWITLFHLNWDALTAEAEPLCLHNSSWTCQDAHPHPIFGPEGHSVWFTSDREGNRAVYEVEL